MKKGLFICLEGPEGSGKSTHLDRVEKDIASRGYDVVKTYEPGDTSLGREIREILLKKEAIKLGRLSELLLFEADRAQHVEEFIKPNLDKGRIVLCDRYSAATVAYQGYGLGVSIDKIKQIDKIATSGIYPDLTLVLDVDIETGIKRAGKVGFLDRLEKRSLEFHLKVREGYLKQAPGNGSGFKVVDAARSENIVYNDIFKEVIGFVERYYRAG